MALPPFLLSAYGLAFFPSNLQILLFQLVEQLAYAGGECERGKQRPITGHHDPFVDAPGTAGNAPGPCKQSPPSD